MPSVPGTPGVYVEETGKPFPSVIQVESAIPAFIGYTERDTFQGMNLIANPKKIRSLAEFVEIFGVAKPVRLRTGAEAGIKIRKENGQLTLDGNLSDPVSSLVYRLYYSLQLYFGNGGGPCFIVSCGAYKSDDTVSDVDMASALQALTGVDEPTMILFTDAVSLADSDEYYALCNSALSQCARLKDRFAIIDVHLDAAYNGVAPFADVESGFRDGIGTDHLSYGAAYYPWLKTTLAYHIDESATPIVRGDGVLPSDIPDGMVLRNYPGEGEAELSPQDIMVSLYHARNELYTAIRQEFDRFSVILPPSPAIAGVYATVDRTRGVWKAPANVTLNCVAEPAVMIGDREQEGMNITPTGKSVNAIRYFPGRGVLVWGARTLAGNDLEWRYVNVRRFFLTVEESIVKSTQQFVFEPNDSQTWVRVIAMIQNYLDTLWRQGALAGSRLHEACFVEVGLGTTMTAQDIIDGVMVVEVGLAVTRPAEFIILRFCQKMAVS